MGASECDSESKVRSFSYPTSEPLHLQQLRLLSSPRFSTYPRQFFGFSNYIIFPFPSTFTPSSLYPKNYINCQRYNRKHERQDCLVHSFHRPEAWNVSISPADLLTNSRLIVLSTSSGLRKKVVVFQKPHYSESFVTSILLSIPEGVEGSFLVIGGDGRYWNPEVVQLIAKIGAAYGVKKLLIGQNGILSTPAASHIIRKRKATGGILLTASHNAGGKFKPIRGQFQLTCPRTKERFRNQVQPRERWSSTRECHQQDLPNLKIPDRIQDRRYRGY